MTLVVGEPDLKLSDALDAMLLYRNLRTGQVLFTLAPESGSDREKASWLSIPSGRGFWEAAKFNPVGSTVAIGDFDGRLLIYDYAAKSTIFQTAVPGTVITQVAFSADGKLLASIAHPQGCVRFTSAFGNYSLNGKSATCSFTSLITVRDATSGKELYSGSLEPAHEIVFTPDNRALAVSSNQRIQLVDFSKKVVTRSFPLTLDRGSLSPGEGMFVHMAFSPDGRWLAETGHGRVYLFDVASGHVVRSLADPPMAHIANSILTRDGRLLAAVTRPDRIVVTELSPGVSSRILKMNPAGLPAISADGSTLAGVGTDRKVRTWNINRAELQCTTPPGGAVPSDTWRRMDLSADGSLLLLPSAPDGSVDQGVEVWDTRACRLAEKIVAGTRLQDVKFAIATQAPERADRELPGVTRVAISPSGRLVGWVTKGNVLYIWNRTEQRTVASIRVPVPAVYSELDSQTPPKVVNKVRSDLGSAPLPPADAAPESLLHFEQLAAGIGGLNFSPDESRLATLDLDGQVRLWSTADGAFLRTLGAIPSDRSFIVNNTLQYELGNGTLAFSPDGRTAASMSFNRSKPMLWDLNTGAALRPITGFTSWSTSIAFTPDGATLMALGFGSNMLAIDTATGGRLAEVTTFGDGQEWLVHT
ncbi:MAG: WD40 repeat domain-containing protein [Acidobacteriia bacterium]|nr:WD40 repeat domain-containing protein [Terriglobia bacterium]